MIFGRDEQRDDLGDGDTSQHDQEHPAKQAIRLGEFIRCPPWFPGHTRRRKRS